MEGNKKQVIMTYEEHQQWIKDRDDYENQLEELTLENEKFAKLAKESIETAVCENGDLIVIDYERVQVGKKRDDSIGYMRRHERWKYVYEWVPRFLGKDDVARIMDKHYQDLVYQINKLTQDKEYLEKDIKDQKFKFENNFRTFDIKIWNALSKKSQERIRKILYKAEQKLAKK